MAKSILFLSIENRARTQIAEGLARHFLSHQSDVASAGTEPADRIHPMAVAVMAEIGEDISHQRPKNVDSIRLDHVDLIVVISNANADRLPQLPVSARAKILTWPISDPVASDAPAPDLIRKFRKVRDEIRKRVLELRASDQTW